MTTGMSPGSQSHQARRGKGPAVAVVRWRMFNDRLSEKMSVAVCANFHGTHAAAGGILDDETPGSLEPLQAAPARPLGAAAAKADAGGWGAGGQERGVRFFRTKSSEAETTA